MPPPPPPPPPLTLPTTPLHFKLSRLSVSLGLSICLYASLFHTPHPPFLCGLSLSLSLPPFPHLFLSLSLPHSWANLSVSQSLCLSLSVSLSLSISPLLSFSFPRFRLAPVAETQSCYFNFLRNGKLFVLSVFKITGNVCRPIELPVLTSVPIRPTAARPIILRLRH